MSAFIVAIYLSTAAAVIFSACLGLLWLVTGQYRKLPNVISSSPVSLWGLALFTCFLIGLGYGDTPKVEAFSIIRKYREFVFIPILSCFFTEEKYRIWAWRAFFAGGVLTLIGSSLLHFGHFHFVKFASYSLKSRITHSILIAYFVFYCAHSIFTSEKHRVGYALLALLCAYNIFFVVNGRTGQLILLMLALLFSGQRFGIKGLLIGVASLILFLSLYIGFSDKSARIYEGYANTESYLKHNRERTLTSMGLRYSLWENSLHLIAEKPLLGHGTGSFAKEYQRITGEKRRDRENPHNEALLITVQFGLAGFAVYCGFLLSQFSCAKKMDGANRWLAQGILLSLIVTSLFNSPFLDHTEGHWFAVMIALCFSPLLYNLKQDIVNDDALSPTNIN
jgi:O-antigen ligase